MHKIIKQSMVLLLITALLFVPLGATAFAEDQVRDGSITAGKMIADFFLLRPVGIIATAAGAVFYVVSIPFSGPGYNKDMVRDRCVKEPMEFTFARPLGDF